MREPALVLVLVVGLVGPPSAAAMDPPPSMEAGRVAYEAGDFGAAVEHYRDALAAGADHPIVHYNLGNALFKSGELGEAIASYVRAQRRAPRDDRIRANLRVARAQIRDRELADESLPAVFVPVRWLYDRFSLNEWWILTLVVFGLIVLVSVAGQWERLDPPWVRRLVLGLTVVAGVSATMGVVRYRTEVARTGAVVVEQEVEVRSGPGSDYSLAFRVHEGLQVEVSERRPDWVRIDLGGELVGWVPTRSLEVL
ncbi:MAG TPA: tetratricopeptide repeat protein [Candidatus Krumholzibacteria bacterium]|nr:tetratricopeptide repeat protein [Candidatus Krumholzibacteria bacterium]